MLTFVFVNVILLATAKPQSNNIQNKRGNHDSSTSSNPPLPPVARNDTGNSSILKNEFVDDGAGNFRWAFETSNGIKAEQTGVPGLVRSGNAAADGKVPKNETTESEEEGGAEISGSYSYIAPDGQMISVTYTAGVDGFRPKGAHIPITLPPNFSSSTRDTAPLKPIESFRAGNNTNPPV